MLRFIFILGLYLLTLVIGDSHAESQTSDYVHLIGLASYKCISVKGGSVDNDAVVELWDCPSYATNEQWAIQGENLESWYNNNNFYMLKAKRSEKCLTVQNGSTANEAAVNQYDCLAQSNQLWKFEKDSNGFYTIISKASNKCLTVHYGGIENGAPLEIYDCFGKDNQKWIPAS